MSSVPPWLGTHFTVFSFLVCACGSSPRAPSPGPVGVQSVPASPTFSGSSTESGGSQAGSSTLTAGTLATTAAGQPSQTGSSGAAAGSGGNGAAGTEAAGSGGMVAAQSGAGGGGGTPGAVAGGGALAPTNACGESSLSLPEDPGVRGPWDVGVRTIKLGRLTVEVLYPAQPGSTVGKPEATYNLIDFLPPQERSKIPPDHSPEVGPVGGHLYRDVPIDSGHGPYPVIVFIHGTASMRIGSGSTNTHWASRGNIVLAADYPGLGLLDQLNEACGYPITGKQDIPGDVKTQLTALREGTGTLQFLSGRADLTRLGISGHSQGACMTAQLANLENVKLILPMTGSTVVSKPAPSLKSIMWIAGMDDTVIGYDSALIGNVVCPANPDPAVSNVTAYDSAPGQPDVKKRLVGIKGGGHLSVTDLCQKNMQGRNAVEEAQADNVCGVETAVIIGLPALNDCGPGTLPWMKGVEIVNYVSAAAIDETLHCQNREPAFSMLQTRFPEIGDFRHEP